MIVRTWHGCVSLKHADGFARHPEKTVLGHAKCTEGNPGAYLRRETQGDWEHFFLATWLQDLTAIKGFAGENDHVAQTYHHDERFELHSDPQVFSTTSSRYTLEFCYASLSLSSLRMRKLIKC